MLGQGKAFLIEFCVHDMHDCFAEKEQLHKRRNLSRAVQHSNHYNATSKGRTDLKPVASDVRAKYHFQTEEKADEQSHST